MLTHDTMFFQQLYAHQWDEDDLKALQASFTERTIQLALEKAGDKRDWETFD